MDGRRRITLYDQMAATTTTSLAELILHDSVILTEQKTDSSPTTADTTATTTSAAGSCQVSQNRTLIDILREDPRHNNNNNNSTATTTTTATTDRKSWKASFNFIDKLRLKLALPSSSDSTEIGNNSVSNHTNSSESQTRLDSDESTQRDATQQQQQQNDVVEAAAQAETVAVAAGPVGVSLMDLLEETDLETGFEVSSNRGSDADFYEDMNEEFEGESGVVEHNCCVCMVRHKGAAFIPCGHTFCRTCSREVWVNRGNCPLCNNLILEVLDIF